MHQTTYQPQCKCGKTFPECPDRKAAEVLADVHEAQARRAYQHDTTVLAVQR